MLFLKPPLILSSASPLMTLRDGSVVGGSFTGSASTETGSTATDSVDQVSPTMPRATKNRVSGKLRRSASAISKSSN
ncbi:hypothetical protein EYF80_006710 [Liparis tanakae]|uniref:Uncharacterized protein n=1 Tax=Liparis tanakae TaxID=230148 RepID=A0A4Z2J0X3_9TELE|nr:hypothetical protein EYF80_006710 [Liparis tanakae]